MIGLWLDCNILFLAFKKEKSIGAQRTPNVTNLCINQLCGMKQFCGLCDVTKDTMQIKIYKSAIITLK